VPLGASTDRPRSSAAGSSTRPQGSGRPCLRRARSPRRGARQAIAARDGPERAARPPPQATCGAVISRSGSGSRGTASRRRPPQIAATPPAPEHGRVGQVHLPSWQRTGKRHGARRVGGDGPVPATYGQRHSIGAQPGDISGGTPPRNPRCRAARGHGETGETLVQTGSGTQMTKNREQAGMPARLKLRAVAAFSDGRESRHKPCAHERPGQLAEWHGLRCL